MPPISGVMLGTAAMPSASGRKRDVSGRVRDDVCVAVLPRGVAAAGVFTRSRLSAAPVEWSRTQIRTGTARVLVVNAGNANACTGRAGMRTVRAACAAAAAAARCRQRDVLVASTGVIGQPLDPGPLTAGITAAMAAAAPGGWEAAARAIMTTDTIPKAATRTVDIAGSPAVINGIAKGSGMTAPDMATVLAFVFTDAALSAPVAQTLLDLSVRDSFNAITVDGDTSTNDTALLFATGADATGADAAGADRRAIITRPGDRRLRAFRTALNSLMQDLAQQVVRNGDGAEKFVSIAVAGAVSRVSARRIAQAVANSPLVKTAIAGADANWGRIVMAVGKAGEPVSAERLAITIGGVDVARAGAIVPGYDETPVARHMKGTDIDIGIDVGVGRGAARVWTCDLGHGYISINADYRS